MSSDTLERRFAAVGARVKVAQAPWRGEPRINIHADARGEYFDIRFTGSDAAVELDVVDVQPHDRHLLLLARVNGEKSKFLCGHDERHWFVAAIPEAARGVTGVAAAKAALQADAAEGSVPAPQRGVRASGRVVLRPGARRSAGCIRAPGRAVDAGRRQGAR